MKAQAEKFDKAINGAASNLLPVRVGFGDGTNDMGFHSIKFW